MRIEISLKFWDYSGGGHGGGGSWCSFKGVLLGSEGGLMKKNIMIDQGL